MTVTTGAAGETRLRALHDALAPAGVDLLALAPTDNLRYALRGYAPVADERFQALLITPSALAFVVPALNAAQARAHVEAPFHVYTDDEGPAGALAAALDTLSAREPALVAVDEEMRAEHLLLLQHACPAARYRPAGTLVADARSRKDAEEIARLKVVAATADAGVRAVIAACAPGMSERALAEIAATAMRQAGAQEATFTLVGAGAHSALPHHHTSETIARAGDVLVIDIGSRLDGYCSDITRMAVVPGAPPDPEFRRVHTVVDEAVRAALAAARPGARARDVDAAARTVITAAGYGAYFVHRTGHGLGLSVHEPPYITASSETVLADGMVFSIEPGIYLPGRFGIRLEEIVYLDAEGAHVLSALPRQTWTA